MGVENLAPILRWLYPTADPMRDWQIDDSSDGTGPRIVRWNSTLGQQPTRDEVMAKEPQWKASLRKRRRFEDVVTDVSEWVGPGLPQAKINQLVLLLAAEAALRDPKFLRRHDIPVDGDEPDV